MDRSIIGFYRSNTGFYGFAAAADLSKMPAEYFVFSAYLSKLIFYRSKIAVYHSTGIAYRYKMIFHWYKLVDYHSKMVLEYFPSILGKSAMIFYWYKMMVEYSPVILESFPSISEQYRMNLETSPVPTINDPPISIHSPPKLVQKVESSKSNIDPLSLSKRFFLNRTVKTGGGKLAFDKLRLTKPTLNLNPFT